MTLVKIALISISCLLRAQGPASIEDPGGWGKAKWGMTDDQILAAFPGQAIRLTGPVAKRTFGRGAANIGIEQLRIGGWPFNVYFIGGHQSSGLAHVVLSATNTDILQMLNGVETQFLTLERLLSDKYGPPRFRDDRGSLSREMRCKWVLPTTVIDLSWMGPLKPIKNVKFAPLFSIGYSRNQQKEELDKL